MSASAIKTALRYVAGWGMTLLFVGLLTLIFSFLGAFFCAALAGMMVGSVKLPRWQTVVASLIAPAVLCAILRTGGAELLTRQLLVLSLLCLGIFWLTYLVIYAVVQYEHKALPATAMRPGARKLEQAQGGAESGSTPASTVVRPWGELSLQLLQGKWSCAAGNGNSHAEQKLMEIEEERLVLTISDSAGKVSFLGKGEVRLSNHQPVGRLTVSDAVFGAADDTTVSI